MESERASWTVSKQVIERAMWASKLLLLFVGAISTAMLVKVAVVPFLLDRSLSVWESFRGWVSPFYIYLAVNFIIAAIALSSSFHRIVREPGAEEEDKVDVKAAGHGITPSAAPLEKSGSWDTFRLVGDANPCEVDKVNAGVNEAETVNVKSSSWEASTGEADKVNAGASDSDTVNAGIIEAEPVNATEVDPPESSMDDTWQAIVEGRRGLDRSRTMAPAWRLERIDAQGDRRLKPAEKEVKKWRTFNDRVSLTREESMSPEELSLRAEAFIKKVNEDMRLQRLESDQRFMDMVNRGL